jgi:hypothetical protein
MKTLSIKQPFAELICRGIKTIENRSWDTKYRGKLLIHASSRPLAWPGFEYMPRDFVKGYQKFYGTDKKNIPAQYRSYMNWLEELYKFYHLEKESGFTAPLGKIKEKSKEYGCALITQAIIGEAELTDTIQNSKDVFAIPGDYHWVLCNPVLYGKPILNVMGKLRLWDYEG